MESIQAPGDPRAAHSLVDRGLYGVVVAAVLLSLGHHLDHVLRGATGWPLEGEVNPFTYSLLIYPAIATGLLLSRRGRAGPRFWFVLAGGGALFVLAVHIGPVAGDSIGEIPGGYASPIAGTLAVVELVVFIGALVVAAARDGLAWRRMRAGSTTARGRAS